jgi:hypothetical protein
VLPPASLDVIGIQISGPTRYFGPNTALIERKKLGDWLSTIMSPAIQSIAANPREVFAHTPRLTALKNMKRRGSFVRALGGLSAMRK